jgi:hypothetical protein
MSMEEPSKVAKFRLTAAIAEIRIHEVSQATEKVKLSHHARLRMLEREISMTEVYRILRLGTVETQPIKTERGDWKCKITLPLRGRRTGGVVVALNCTKMQVTLMTVEWEDGK